MHFALVFFLSFESQSLKTGSDNLESTKYFCCFGSVFSVIEEFPLCILCCLKIIKKFIKMKTNNNKTADSVIMKNTNKKVLVLAKYIVKGKCKRKPMTCCQFLNNALYIYHPNAGIPTSRLILLQTKTKLQNKILKVIYPSYNFRICQ